MKNPVNPFMWGAIGAVLAVAATTIGRLTFNPDGMPGYSFVALVGGGFFWGMIAAMLWNWAGKRKS